MKNLILIAVLVLFSVVGANSFAKDKPGKETVAKEKDTNCHFSNMEQLNDHLNNHVKYPSTGKEIKAVCKKEWPDEFTKEESACADSKLKDKTKYMSATDVKKALGI